MKYIDENGLLYLVQKIKTWDGNKVDKETGKGLSTNDFTTSYKTTLDNLATNYVAVESGKGLSTNDYDATEKAKVAAAQTASDVSTAITTALGSYSTTSEMNSAIAAAVGNIAGVAFSIVADYASLPQEGAAGIIYLVPNAGNGNNTYDEYIWITIGNGNEATSRYEKIGTTAVDLSGYVQTTDLSAITNAEIDTIVTNASSGS